MREWKLASAFKRLLIYILIFRKSPLAAKEYCVAMELRTYRFCLAARVLSATHGSYFAAVFLFENGIGIEAALLALASRGPVAR